VGAGIFLPVSFLTGLFGVNVGGMPGLNSPWAFAILCGAMVLLALVLVAIIRRMKWL
jgi:zinc transporter